MAIDLDRAQIAPGVYRLGHRLVNWYLVADDGGLTVVDAGAPAHWVQLGDALSALGHEPADVGALILTHPDADHIGFAERLRAKAGVAVHVHEADRDQAAGERTKDTERSMLAYLWRPALLDFIAFAIRTGPRPTPIAELETFADGDQLDVPGRPRVVHVPGHTRGHCAFHFADHGVAFTGDALVTRDPLTGRTGPRLIGRAFNESTEGARESLARIGALDVRTLLPGHGDPWTGGAARAAELARKAEVV